MIDARSHVRLAHPDQNNGIQLLRRGYNYVDGNTGLGKLDAGLFFLAYQRRPEEFVTVQRALSMDAMNEYLRHLGVGPVGDSTGRGRGLPRGGPAVRLNHAMRRPGAPIRRVAGEGRAFGGSARLRRPSAPSRAEGANGHRTAGAPASFAHRYIGLLAPARWR